jgi:uncharacterized membrane protein
VGDDWETSVSSRRVFSAQAVEQTSYRKRPIVGFFTGLFVGALLLVFGLIFSVVFLPLGIIVLLAGVLMPFLSLGMREGACPNCGSTCRTIKETHKCSSCKHRLIFRGGFIRDVT